MRSSPSSLANYPQLRPPISWLLNCGKNYLGDFIGEETNNDSSLFSGRIELMDGNANSGANDMEEGEPMDVTNAVNQGEPKKRIVGTFKVSSTVTTEKASMPKWFKTAK